MNAAPTPDLTALETLIGPHTYTACDGCSGPADAKARFDGGGSAHGAIVPVCDDCIPRLDGDWTVIDDRPTPTPDDAQEG